MILESRKPRTQGADPPRRVFISYTGKDLDAFADVVIDVVRRKRWIAIDHRDWAPSGIVTVPECRREIEDCDIVVALVAHRYGWVPPSDEGGDGRTSITWWEYKWARELRIPVVPFVIDDGARWPEELIESNENPAVLAPLSELKAELRRHITAFFTAEPLSLLEKLEIGLDAAVTQIPVLRPAGQASIRPEKLPYLCDRSDQSRMLQTEIRAHLKAASKRPLTFLIHGDAAEAHVALVQRIEGHVLPSLVAREPPGGECRFIYLNRLRSWAPASFADDLRAELADKLRESQIDSDAALIEWLRHSRLRGIAAVLEVRSSECADPGAALETIHAYWRGLPDLPMKFLSLCFVCVKYDDSAEGTLKWVRTAFGAGSRDKAMRRAIEALQVARSEVRAPLCVLPELHGVTPTDVDDWINNVRDWLPDSHIPDKERLAVFADGRTASMDSVIKHLEGLLERQSYAQAEER